MTVVMIMTVVMMPSWSWHDRRPCQNATETKTQPRPNLNQDHNSVMIQSVWQQYANEIFDFISVLFKNIADKGIQQEI